MTLVSILYIIFAILGLSFLIFIHELGHYYMARRLGMRVETFSIGFGKPIYYWMQGGVRWQIGWLLFGGYVKIAGMEAGEQRDIYDIEDGFFGKKPLDRIKVAFMGPFVNIVFALLAFTALWTIGGREKKFSEFTHKIGWIDPRSELYLKGMRPGDEIISYNGHSYEGVKDHVSIPMTHSGSEVEIDGFKVDPQTKRKTPFSYRIKPYPNPNAFEKDILTLGILNPASYIIYGKQTHEQENSLPEGSPMHHSGIQHGDRIVWADGIEIYSLNELSHTLNDSKALVTVRRGSNILLRRVPRVRIEELKLSPEIKEEILDWQFEAKLKGAKLQKLYYIPYNLNNEGLVEGPLKFIDQEKDQEVFSKNPFGQVDQPLQEGDRILAIDGEEIHHAFQILSLLQEHRVNIVVERDPKIERIVGWQLADGLFDQQYKWDDLREVTSQIGISKTPHPAGNLYLLNPVVPKTQKDFSLSEETRAQMQEDLQEEARSIDNIEDPEKRAHVKQLYETRSKQLFLGLPYIEDVKVEYNPNPFRLFYKVFEEIWHTLKALVSGSLNPKWMSGPIGIVQVVHDNSMVSLKEALFWLGAISLNLGVLNLLPLPVLDGGTICLSIYELITGKRLKSKTLEKLIIPFAVLLMGFFLFLTYHDLSRLLSHWSPW